MSLLSIVYYRLITCNVLKVTVLEIIIALSHIAWFAPYGDHDFQSRTKDCRSLIAHEHAHPSPPQNKFALPTLHLTH